MVLWCESMLGVFVVDHDCTRDGLSGINLWSTPYLIVLLADNRIFLLFISSSC